MVLVFSSFSFLLLRFSFNTYEVQWLGHSLSRARMYLYLRSFSLELCDVLSSLFPSTMPLGLSSLIVLFCFPFLGARCLTSNHITFFLFQFFSFCLSSAQKRERGRERKKLSTETDREKSEKERKERRKTMGNARPERPFLFNVQYAFPLD